MGVFSERDLERARARLGMIPFFPQDRATQSEIMIELAGMCPSLNALWWVTDTAVAKCKAWPGMMELRGILCWRYRPADGVTASCTLPGLTATDGEMRYIAASGDRKQIETRRRITGEVEPFAVDPELDAKCREAARRAKLSGRLLPAAEAIREKEFAQVLEALK